MLMLLTNLALTGFARIPLSTSEGQHPSLEKWLGAKAAQKVARLYETPLPQDWVGFATQMHHQASGGASYLWGERRIERLVVLLLRGAGGQGAARLLAPGGRAVGTQSEFVAQARERRVFSPPLRRECQGVVPRLITEFSDPIPSTTSHMQLIPLVFLSS